MKSKRNKISVGILAVVVIGIVIMIIVVTSADNRLSKEEILELRQLYPIHKIESSFYHFTPKKLEQLIEEERICSFVYGEVLGDVTNYTEKLMDFFQYQILVIEDTEGRYQEGDVVTIYSNAIQKEFYPEFSDEMKVIIPLIEEEEMPFKDIYVAVGTYYVTEKGYVLSAYDENQYAESTYTGLHVNVLLEKLKELIK